MKTTTVEVPTIAIYSTYLLGSFIAFGSASASFTENFHIQAVIGGIGAALAGYGVYITEEE